MTDSGMLAKHRGQWTEADLLAVARLICDPTTNGGTVALIEPEEVVPLIPDAPALALFDEEGMCAFVVGFNPYHLNPLGTAWRGVLHVAGDGRVSEAWRIVRAFLDALPEVEVFSLTTDRALARLARRAGLSVVGESSGTLILVRVAGPQI